VDWDVLWIDPDRDLFVLQLTTGVRATRPQAVHGREGSARDRSPTRGPRVRCR